MPAEALRGQTLDGFVNITGAWQGAVVVQCPRRLAEDIAVKLFSLNGRQPSPEELQDALGEITNMTGGNLKALVPGQCYLSLSAVIEGTDYTLRMLGTEAVRRVVFSCQGQPFAVSVVAASNGSSGLSVSADLSESDDG